MDTVLLDPRRTTAGWGGGGFDLSPPQLSSHAEQAEKDVQGEVRCFVKPKRLQVFILDMGTIKKLSNSNNRFIFNKKLNISWN